MRDTYFHAPDHSIERSKYVAMGVLATAHYEKGKFRRVLSPFRPEPRIEAFNHEKFFPNEFEYGYRYTTDRWNVEDLFAEAEETSPFAELIKDLDFTDV